MNEEGVIKFKSTWTKKHPSDTLRINDLNTSRQNMYNLGLIGCTPDGIGYGNISKRWKGNRFIISGSGTGSIELTSEHHYTLVCSYDFAANSLTSEGPVMASSESLTHAMIYECNSHINAVIHIHHAGLWQQLLTTLPYTSKDVEYGTPEMAIEIRRLFLESGIMKHRIFAMGGHQDGIIAFGESPEAAEKIILQNLACGE